MKLTDIEILENFITDGLAKYSITENWQLGVLLEFGKYYHKQVKNNDSLDSVVGQSEQLKFLNWYVKDEASRTEPDSLTNIVDRYLKEF